MKQFKWLKSKNVGSQTFLKSVCLLGLLLVSVPAVANTFSAKGTFSQPQTPTAQELLDVQGLSIPRQLHVLAKAHPYLDASHAHPQQRIVKAWIQTLAVKHKIPKHIALALCAHESGNWQMWQNHKPITNTNFSPDNEILSQDWGAMQLNDKAHPAAFPRAKEDLLFHLDYALSYLAQLHQHTRGSLNLGFGSWDKTLAAYNLGHAPTQEELTHARAYVSKVVDRVKSHRLHPTLKYTVQPGDTLSVLAKRHLKSTHWKKILTLNNLSHPQQLRAGKEILIPII